MVSFKKGEIMKSFNEWKVEHIDNLTMNPISDTYVDQSVVEIKKYLRDLGLKMKQNTSMSNVQANNLIMRALEKIWNSPDLETLVR